MEAFVAEMSKIGMTSNLTFGATVALRLVQSNQCPCVVRLYLRVAWSGVLGGHVSDPVGLVLPRRGRVASFAVNVDDGTTCNRDQWAASVCITK